MKSVLRTLVFFIAAALGAGAQTPVVTITKPSNGAVSSSAVTLAASTTNWNAGDHLEVWDANGNLGGIKLGNVFASSFNTFYGLPNGVHTTTVNVISSTNQILSTSRVTYTVSETCNPATSQCNFDQQGIANPDTSCNNAPVESTWVGNPCAAQGPGSSYPLNYKAQEVTTSLADDGLSLNGESLLLSETQASTGYSNVIFSAYSPVKTPVLYSHWTMDEYVYIPNPKAHQAIEFDLQYVWGGHWTKFYTECAFNMGSGTGFWAVYGGGNGWAFLNGTNGAPYVPCNQSQFSTPWTGGPAFTGWHHIVWTFHRNPAGYAEFLTLTFDNTVYQVNYTPSTALNGGSNQGDFAALVQLDGAKDATTYPTVPVYINQLNITHTP